MKPFAITTALFSFISVALAGATTDSKTSKVILPVDFKPPQVFKNANLVHVISLEKTYVKEQINVLVENVAKEPQTEYYVPFTTEQLPRIGGFEVKDRKDANAGPFVAEIVEYDPLSDVQYYRIRLPTPLKPGAQQTLGITYYYLKAYTPLPVAVSQDDDQYLSFNFSVYAPSAYITKKQKTELKAASADVPDYTKLPGSGEVKEFPVKQGTKLTYGPFDEKPAGAVSPANVRFQFTKPVIHVKELDRLIEVSHWGGNIAFEEYYELYHGGANLSDNFDRIKYSQHSLYRQHGVAGVRPSHYLDQLRIPLPGGSVDAYYTDVIGNVTTSTWRTDNRDALLVLKPRYPLFGGWRYPFTIGWNSDASNFLRKTATGSFVLRIPFIEGPKQPEGVEYEHINVNVLLPEGAENVKFHTNIPESSIVSTSVDLTRTYLDTVGRTAVSIKARNLVDEFRDRQLIISYEAPLSSALRKPLVIFASAMVVFVTTWALGQVQYVWRDCVSQLSLRWVGETGSEWPHWLRTLSLSAPGSDSMATASLTLAEQTLKQPPGCVSAVNPSPGPSTTITKRLHLLDDTQVIITITITTITHALPEQATPVSLDGPTATAHETAALLSMSAIDRLKAPMLNCIVVILRQAFNMNRALSIRSNKSKGNSGTGAGAKRPGFSFNSLRGQVQPELSRKLFRLIKSENNLISAHETAGRERVSIATQLSEWGEHTGDESISDISDKVGVILSEMGEQEDAYAHALDDSRAELKAIRNTEKSVQPSREKKDKIADEIQKLKLKEPGSTRLPVLEQELVRAEAENLVAEAQLTNTTRQKLKEAYVAEFAATIERAEKQIMLAKHGRRLLELLDDSPVVPGDTRVPYEHSSLARQILNDAEDDLRGWRPEAEGFSTPVQSRSPTLEGNGKEPLASEGNLSLVQSEAATVESGTSPLEQRGTKSSVYAEVAG
ncbi:oligosaccharyl transferase complex subunit OST4 [Fusarium circinatum]|uniref:Dolichyl-diphosphooligosaccharide--protein glycosyltransferase subunit 1 n=1 Tax=Fusarium circinatum TaxID=48490 RepID=A0A8H5TAL1_FUSCI|nr:oligosaccharyl transferase complex subunit OST4 [Fusarium circinatum]